MFNSLMWHLLLSLTSTEEADSSIKCFVGFNLFGSHFQWIRIFCSLALCNGNCVLVAGSNNSRSDRDYFSCSKLCTNWDAGKLHLKLSAILFLSYSQSFGFQFVQFMQEVRMVVSADSVAPAENISPDPEVANDTTTYFMILRILPV